MSMQSLEKATTQLCLDPKYADLEIHCPDQVFKVHRAVVCGASAVMATLCDNGPKQDGLTITRHHDANTDAMDRLLQFIYRGTYTLDPNNSMSAAYGLGSSTALSRTSTECHHPESSKEELMAHAMVSNIANKYEMPELELLAQDHFAAARHNAGCLELKDMVEVATEVYSRTPWKPDGLRREVLDMILQQSDKYLNDCGFIRSITKDEWLQDLAMDTLASVAIRHEESRQRVEQHDEDLRACRKNVSQLSKNLEAARLQTKAVDSELQKKEKLHETTVKQFKSDIQRLQDEMATKEDAANSCLSEETLKIKRGYEDRIMRIKQQGKDQDRLRHDQVTAATEKLTQANSSLAAIKVEHAELKTEKAVSDAVTEELIQANGTLAAFKVELNELKIAKAASDAIILDLQGKNRHLFQKMRESQQSLQSAKAGPQNQLVKLNVGLQNAQDYASDQVALVRSQKKNMERLEDKLYHTQKDVHRLEDKLKDARDDASLRKSVVKQLLEFDDIKECRYHPCHWMYGPNNGGFEYYLEAEGPTGYVARCKRCTTRHFGSENSGVI